MHILEIKCNEDHARVSVARLASGRAIAFLPGNVSYTLVRFEEKKKTCPFLKTGKNQGLTYLRVKWLPAGDLGNYWPKTGNGPCGGREVGSPHLLSQTAAPKGLGVDLCSCLWLVKCCASTGFITSLSSCFKRGAQGRTCHPKSWFCRGCIPP